MEPPARPEAGTCAPPPWTAVKLGNRAGRHWAGRHGRHSGQIWLAVVMNAQLARPRSWQRRLCHNSRAALPRDRAALLRLLRWREQQGRIVTVCRTLRSAGLRARSVAGVPTGRQRLVPPGSMLSFTECAVPAADGELGRPPGSWQLTAREPAGLGDGPGGVLPCGFANSAGLGPRAEDVPWAIAGYGVLVAPGGDDADVCLPGSRGGRAGGRRAESLEPRWPGGGGDLGEAADAGRDHILEVAQIARYVIVSGAGSTGGDGQPGRHRSRTG